MRLDKYIKTLPNGTATLFNDTNVYPAPFDVMGRMIADKAVRDFAGLKVSAPVLEYTEVELQQLIYEELLLNKYQIEAYNKLLAAMDIDTTDADYVETRTYGEDSSSLVHGQSSVTSNVGARSNADTMGATDGTTTNTDTSYESSTGKTTTTAHTVTTAVTNTSTSQAAIDSTVTAEHTDINTRDEHVDTIERYHNVGASDVPDYLSRWMAIKDKGIIIALEKIVVDALTIPYYED